MSITAHRATLLAAAAGSLFLASGPVAAQADQRTAINILVECSKIEEPTARLACYDNNIGQARNSIPSALPVPPRGVGGGPPPAGPGAQGFGSESVRVQQERFTPRPSEEQEVAAVVTAVREREPGVYLITIEGGAEWLFAESVGRFYRPPQPGETIEIERGALGSFLLRAGEQQQVSVRRLR